MFTENMLESIKKVEATREERMKTEPRRMTAEEKENLLKSFHPDYREAGFDEIKVGPNKGQYDELIEQVMQKPITEMKELYNTREIEK